MITATVVLRVRVDVQGDEILALAYARRKAIEAITAAVENLIIEPPAGGRIGKALVLEGIR